MKKLATILMLGLMVLAFAPLSNAHAQGKVVRITLIDENGSGEDGSAQLTDQGDGTTKVELIMLNAPEGAVQPAHIHKGSCANLDPNPLYPLNSITESKSTTVIKVPLADLTGQQKYAINVHKSETEVSVYVSCGNLPTASTTSSGPMTMDQVLTTLLDQATELAGTVEKKEADASKNAYTIYHGTFAAHEDEIKAKSAPTQAKLEDAMHGVNDAINEGNFDEAETAAEKLIDTIKEAQASLGASSSSSAGSSGSAAIPMDRLQSAAADLLRETKNADKDGSDAAYNDFHDLFAANEDAIKARSADAQAHIEDAMHEVRDAVAAGDFTKASTAAQELVNEVNDATSEVNGTAADAPMPTSGQAASSIYILALVAAGLVILVAGSALRRKAN